MSRIKILLIIGTRPEAIKMAPMVHALSQENEFFETRLCDTGQHRELKQPVLDFFQIHPDYQLDAISANFHLSGLTAYLLAHLQRVIEDFQPDLILVQGDTTSALAGALAGFYNRVKIGHIEAGLRTYNKHVPFPEEINRRIISQIADLHFAPTSLAKDFLLKEGVDPKQVFEVGNTVVDALHFALATIGHNVPSTVAALRQKIEPLQKQYAKMLLLTLHRRENLLYHLDEIAHAIRAILQKEDCFALFPMHPNPAVRLWAESMAKNLPNLILTEALPYEAFVWAMQTCDLILTDSGGIQEEAPSLGKAVIVLRHQTERPEAQQAGIVHQVSINSEEIERAAARLLAKNRMAQSLQNPFGEGASAGKIVDLLKKLFSISPH